MIAPVFILVVAMIAAMGVVMVISRRGKKATPSGVSTAHFTRVIAVIYVAGAVIGTAVTVLQTLLETQVRVSLPVAQFWPRLPAAVEDIQGVSAHVVGGGFTMAPVDVAGLSVAARLWLAAGGLLQGVTAIVIGLVIVMLCTSVIKQNPFRANLLRAVNLAAVSIVVGGLGWQVCNVVGGGLASGQVLGSIGYGLNLDKLRWDDIHDVIGLPQAGHNFAIDFWPIGIGLALFLIAAVFRQGQHLQNDTDGLV